MLSYKSYIGNNTNRGVCFVTLLLSAIFFQSNLIAQPCTMYMISKASLTLPVEQIQDASIRQYDDFNEAILNSASGEVICFKGGVYPALRINNIQGGTNNITLKALANNQVDIINNDYKGAGITINNAANIVISGFRISGGLYGIYAKGSTDLNIINNLVTNVGQEGIIIKSGMSQQPLINFVIAENVISETGKVLSQYGEGIYIGDGNDDFNEELHYITIENNAISNTMNEAIDIKINAKQVTIFGNTIANTNLKFNGAITVATSDRFGTDSNVTIKQNTIKGVVNRSGYRAIGIAVGQGNTLISDNFIVEDSENFAGICLFSTFVNEQANQVHLGENTVITQGRALLINCGNGGTKANNLAKVNYLTAVK